MPESHLTGVAVDRDDDIWSSARESGLAGMNDFLSKPLMLSALESALARWSPQTPGVRR